jgi:hypothetical protein
MPIPGVEVDAMTQSRALTAPVGSLVVGLLVGLLLSGCGSVGDVGYGASRAGVEPVRGVYGSGSSAYPSADAGKQQERAKSLAKANQKAEKKTAALLNKAKALPDGSGPEAPKVEIADQPTLEPSVKSLVAQQERTQPASDDLIAGSGYRPEEE